jgi:hypothetical protein
LISRKAEDSELVSLASKSSGLFKHKTAFGMLGDCVIIFLSGELIAGFNN